MPTDLVAQAHASVGEARTTLARAVGGSIQTDVHHALATLAEAQQTLIEIEGLFRRVRDLMGVYLARVQGGTEAAPGVQAPAPRADPGPTRPPGQPLSPDRGPNGKRAEQILHELPSPVPTPNPGGKKTHGRIIGEDDAEVITSGRDSESREVTRLLMERGVTIAPALEVVAHVEMKVAARMIRAGERHAEMVINNAVCPGVFGCIRLLPVLLPAGYSLTVHGPGYRRTFEGGQRWSS